MTYNSPNTGPSIFQGGKLKPGIYKIQNLASGTYVDTKDDVRELCGRSTSTLEDGRGQWEIKPLGPGYTIRKAGPATSARPDQFCMMLDGISNGYAVSVCDLPVAWKIKAVTDTKYQGFEYVRIFWGSTNMVWDLAQWGSKADGTRVQVMDNGKLEACRIWELIPVKVDDFDPQPSSSSTHPRDSGSAPPYEANTGNSCCSCTHLATQTDDDGFGTTVIEVTTVTTRKKYRVEDS